MHNILNKFILATSKNQSLLAIKKGLLMSTPIVIVGTLAIVINNLPLQNYQNIMPYLFGSHWKSIGAMVYVATISITSLVIVITISYCLAEVYAKTNNHPIIVSSIAFTNFLILIQPEVTGVLTNISYDYIGGTGLFVAIVTAIASTRLFSFFSNIKAFNPRLFANDPEPTLIYSLHAIFPAILTVTAFVLFKFFLGINGIENICGFIYKSLASPFMVMQNTLFTAFIYIIMVHFYWFFGIHGGNILNYINDDFYAVSMAKNIQDISAGISPHIIFTKPFFDVFVMIGGSGATLCFIFAILIVARKSNFLKLAQFSILPALCNVNELLIFGAPIVLNPIFFIPFIFTPLILTLISYLAISAGLVPYTCADIHWTTPPLIGGYAVTGGAWRGVALQLFNIVVGTLIYIPFVKAALTQKDMEMKNNLKNLSEIVFNEQPKRIKQIINRNDSVGLISRTLASDLEQALKNEEIKIAYQPIVDTNAKVIGAEALFRWTHPKYGYISPPVAIKIAEESEQISQVGQYLFNQVCRQIVQWQKNKDLPQFWVSVNVSVIQVEDGQIMSQITNTLNKYEVDPRFLEVEVTEQLTLTGSKNINTLSTIHQKGVRIAIDDFGMGHSSLQYLKLFPVDVLKIDGSLSRDIIDNPSSQKIIRSITDMCQDLNIKVVVEYVETREQKEILDTLNCDYFQGYLFSPALEPSAFETYLRKTQDSK